MIRMQYCMSLDVDFAAPHVCAVGDEDSPLPVDPETTHEHPDGTKYPVLRVEVPAEPYASAFPHVNGDATQSVDAEALFTYLEQYIP